MSSVGYTVCSSSSGSCSSDTHCAYHMFAAGSCKESLAIAVRPPSSLAPTIKRFFERRVSVLPLFADFTCFMAYVSDTYIGEVTDTHLLIFCTAVKLERTVVTFQGGMIRDLCGLARQVAVLEPYIRHELLLSISCSSPRFLVISVQRVTCRS